MPAASLLSATLTAGLSDSFIGHACGIRPNVDDDPRAHRTRRAYFSSISCTPRSPAAPPPHPGTPDYVQESCQPEVACTDLQSCLVIVHKHCIPPPLPAGQPAQRWPLSEAAWRLLRVSVKPVYPSARTDALPAPRLCCISNSRCRQATLVAGAALQ